MKLFGMPTCKEAFSKRYEMDKLRPMQKLMMKAHMLMCSNCRNFQSILDLLENKMKLKLKSKAEKADPLVIKKLKEEIKKKLH